MRVPREVEKLVNEGRSLSVEGAEALERALEQAPDDLDARARLLGFYSEQHAEAFRDATFEKKMSLIMGRSSPTEARGRHALWLAANAPRAPIAAHSLCHFQMMAPVYAELSALWRRHAAADPPDATLIAHAIVFFWYENEPFADELVAHAEKVLPGDRRWAAFRRQRRAHELVMGDLPVPPDPERLPGESDGDDRPANEARLAEVEALLREGDPDDSWEPDLHGIAGYLSLALGQLDRARRHAEQMLVNDSDSKGTRDAVHDGHLLLGRIALREDDLDRAKAHLILAGRAGGKKLLAVFGPSMRLAKELLSRGERDTVIRYLTLIRASWKRAPIDDWIADIRAGGTPAFGLSRER